MIEDWKCLNCGTINKVDLGNLADQTAPDVEAVLCYACHHHDWLCPEAQDFQETIGGNLDNAFTENVHQPCLRCKGSGIEPSK